MAFGAIPEVRFSEDCQITEKFVRLDLTYRYAHLQLISTELPKAAGKDQYPFFDSRLAQHYVTLEPAIAQILRRYLVFLHLRSGRLFHPVLILEVLKDINGWQALFPPLTRLLRKHASWLSNQLESWKWWNELIQFDDSQGSFNPVYFNAKRIYQPDTARDWLIQHWDSLPTSARHSAFDIMMIHANPKDIELIAIVENEFRGKRKQKANYLNRFLTGDVPSMDEMGKKLKAELNPTEWLNFFLIQTLHLQDPSPAVKLIDHLFPKEAHYDLSETAAYLDASQFNGQIIFNGRPVLSLPEIPQQRFMLNIFREASYLPGSELSAQLVALLFREPGLMSPHNLIQLSLSLPLACEKNLIDLVQEEESLNPGRKQSKLSHKVSTILFFRRLAEDMLNS